MIVIQASSKTVSSLLGSQAYREDSVYRLSHYVLQQPVKAGVLLFHTLTRCMVLVSPDEMANILTNQQLISQWFVVPASLDEQQMCRQVRNIAKSMRPTSSAHTDTYIILTTTDCNARCHYCFEHGVTRISMTAETAHATARYMIDRYDGRELDIEWFGGEPLYNVEAIDIICTELEQAGVRFHSNMVSNGYLFDPSLIERARKLWRLRDVQITLDGKHEIYNRVKRYIYPNVDAYKRVTHNISMLTEAGIYVAIRLNIDEHNISHMYELLDEIAVLFPDRKHVGIGVQPILRYTPEGDGTISKDEPSRDRLLQSIDKFIDHAIKMGYCKSEELPNTPKLYWCMADSGGALTILPQGKISRCKENFEHFIGSVYEDQFDETMIARYQELMPDMPECNTCVFYPNCIRPILCRDTRICYPSRRDSFIRDLQRSMKFAYWKYKNKEKENQTT